MQTRSSDENSVCQSVYLSVTRVDCDKTVERSVHADLYTIRNNIYPSFLKRRMVGGGDRFYVKFWGNRPPLERNRRFLTNNRL